ncbi:MAG: hypothetical protein K9H61_10755 [Bacteroidia bacterium]|nr:hypothetical protein [Bacteroidia bacterium]MCF8447464.1 hypothetical protein [Bacteroidia bacterium]
MKKHLLTVALLCSIFQLFAQSGKERSSIKHNSTYIGLETVFNQSKLNNGYITANKMYGLSLEFMGSMAFGHLTGYALIPDSGVHAKSSITYFDVHYSLPLLKTRGFNIRPEIGYRFVRNSLGNFYATENGTTSGFGMGFTTGISANLGPAMVKLKYCGDASFNMGDNSFNKLNHYASLTVGFSPSNLLMNPKNFSFTGLAMHISDYKKKLIGTSYENVRKEMDGSVSYDKVKHYEVTYKENYGPQNFDCKDVQPFFWIGPRLSTNMSKYNLNNVLASGGVNLGFRYGSWFVNGFYEQGDLLFKEPYKRNYTSQDTAGIPNTRTDGAFSSSSKFGVQLGLDMVTWFQKKDYVYQYSKLKSVTSHFSLIPYVGIGQAQSGNLYFYDPNGETALKNYLIQHPNEAGIDVFVTPKDLTFLQFGLQVGMGAAAFNIEKNLFGMNASSYPLLNTWQLSFSYNLPIVRLFRLMGSKAKYQKAFEEAKKEAKKK